MNNTADTADFSSVTGPTARKGDEPRNAAAHPSDRRAQTEPAAQERFAQGAEHWCGEAPSDDVLSGGRVLVVGGTSGFGLRVAMLAVDAGAHATVIGRTPQHIEAARRALSAHRDAPGNGRGDRSPLPEASMEVLSCDATNPGELRDFAEAREPFDHVISTMGGAMGGGFLDNTEESVRSVVDGKYLVALGLAKTLLPHIADHGTLTLTSGSGGRPYNASGAILGNQAIDTLVQALAVESAPRVRVNAVAPWWTPTGLWRGMTKEQLDDQAAQMAASNPLGRIGTVDEVAETYLFLMRNAFINAQTIRVDGGIGAL